MKIQKISINLKIAAAKLKDISSSKASSPNEGGFKLSRNVKSSRPQSEVNPISTPPGLLANLSRSNPVRVGYSKQNIQTKKIDTLKSLRKSTYSELSSVNADKTSHFPLDIRKEKIEEAKIKLAKGYYSKAEVYSRIAERLIDTLI